MTAPLPRYERVFLQLRERILLGAWPAERPMPGEHDLAAQFSVSRITIRRALQRLEQQKLVSRRQGVGTFALSPAPKRTLRLHGLLEAAVATGSGTELRLLGTSRIGATEEAAELLELPPGTPVREVRRLRAVDGTPYAYLVSWVPEDIGSRLPDEALQNQGMFAMLQAAGVAQVRAEQVISAKLAEEPGAGALRVPAGSALLWVRRRVRDAEGRAVHGLDALYRPELYECHIEMERRGTAWNAELGRAAAMSG
ncbi:MAG TPA: GntR family transcriptional regulator [Acetobacteraceae bacterium]|jgi:GntR family transcriptional regulator|nr:GntR family transcriptional regulator [Acetobacteraceae bacterium]